jgi:(E)-2-((N-methylformamido)methylene)succinate hydrolase
MMFPIPPRSSTPRSLTPGGVAYIDVGTGQPVVLLHGVGLQLEAWAPQIEYLARTHRVIAIDMPGHGASSPIASGSSLASFVDWFISALNELELEAVNVAGHSMGALIAGGCAVVAPERVRRVALLGAVFRRDEAASVAVRARAAEIAAGQLDRLAPLSRWFGDSEKSSDVCQQIAQWLTNVDIGAYATAYNAFAEGDSTYADGWSRVECPALFLTGALDLNSTPQMSIDLAAAAARGEACVVPNHRHMANMTAPAEVNAALQNWLARKV